MKKVVRLTEQELISIIKRNINESNYMYANMERAQIVQDVMDRILEYGDDYVNELMSLNSNFEVKKHKRFESGEFELPKGVKVRSTYRPNR